MLNPFVTRLKNQVQTQEAILQLNALQSRTKTAVSSFQTQAGTCAGTWRCVGAKTPILGNDLETQISTFAAVTFPSGRARADAASIVSTLQEERLALSQMQGATSQQAFQNGLKQLVTLTRNLQPLVAKLRQDLGANS